MTDARSAISDLVYTYAERIDLGDFDGLADLFTHAVVIGGEDFVRKGRDEVLTMYVDGTRRYEDNGTPHTKHVTTNLMVNVDEEAGTATARSYFTVLQALPDSLALQPIIAGRYHDRFEKVDGAWRFSERRMLVDLVGDLSQHLLFEYPPR
jgi:3-phenylpropionate/cinnamic acid dioxygenase small subunit